MKNSQNDNSTKKSSNVIAVYKHACELMQATDALNQISVQIGNTKYLIPVLILDAFSVEIFIKCILTIETGQDAPRIHHLHNLYSKLSKSTRNRIEKIWTWYTEREEDQWQALEKQSGQKISRDLEHLLKTGSKAFELIRYTYDNKENFAYHLYGLSHILDLVAIELKPELGGFPADWRPPTEITDTPPREPVVWEFRSRQS